MKMRFVHEFEFYKGQEQKPFLSFQKGDEIKILSSTDEDPHNHNNRPMTMGGETYIHKDKHYWVEAKNGTTVWTTIHNLLLKGILEPVT